MRAKHRVGLVWNKGIAASCDWRIPDEFPPGRPYTPVPELAGASVADPVSEDPVCSQQVYLHVRPGDVIWVRLAWLKSFAAQVLPLVRSPFVLATGDSDTSVPSGIAGLARQIAHHPMVIHWWAQNCDQTAHRDRISPLPIGIDFHTLSERPYWGERPSPPWQQEQELRAIRSGLRPLADRIPQVYADFQPSMDGSRSAIIAALSATGLAAIQPAPLPRSLMWRRRGDYAFVFSPHGNGLDCHRTWEALALGHIVLVPRSPLDDMYEGLPVVAVTSVADITADQLAEWHARFRGWDTADVKLTSAYWVGRMRDSGGDTRRFRRG